MSYADYKTPGRRLLDMLVETPTFRAICAAPTAEAATLATTLDAGSVPVGDAASRVYFGAVNEDPDRGEVPEKPYGVCRQSEEGTQAQRSSTTGFDYSGRLYLAVACPVPASLRTTPLLAIEDAQVKQDWLLNELAALLRANPRLDVTTLQPLPAGLSITTEEVDEEQFEIIDFNVTCEGVAGGAL